MSLRPPDLPVPKSAPPRRGDGVRDLAKLALHGWGEATAPLRPYPDFLVVGTKRGGTTSLHDHLLRHPDILPMFPARQLKSPMYYTENYARGERWYRAHFPTAPYRAARGAVSRRRIASGEASPYYLYNPHIADRIRRDAPATKIVMLLRDPVDRAYSHYWERVDNLVEPLSFVEALAAEADRTVAERARIEADPLYYSRAHDWYSYRDRGIYAPQIRRYLDAFPREQLLILPSEGFYRDVQATFDVVSDFLGLQPHQLAKAPRKNHLPAPPMDPAVKAELVEFYAPRNEETYALLGRDLGWQR